MPSRTPLNTFCIFLMIFTKEGNSSSQNVLKNIYILASVNFLILFTKIYVEYILACIFITHTLRQGLRRCLTFADCRLQITDCIQWISDRIDYTETFTQWPLAANLEDSSRGELNPTQIFIVLNDHVKRRACVDSVTLTFTRRWPRKAYWGMTRDYQGKKVNAPYRSSN